MPTIVIALPHLSLHDAVSNDARMQCKNLNARGLNAVLFAESWDDNAAGQAIPKAKFEALMQDAHNILIYHMCVYWHKLLDVLDNARCKVVIKYHNMTPPGFFASYDHLSFHATHEGLRQAEHVFKHARIDLVMAASPFNLDDVIELSNQRPLPSAIVAPYVLTDELVAAEASPRIKLQLLDKRHNFIFVGRFVPNKGHLHLVAVARSYKDLFGDDFCLTMIGKASPNFASYRNQVENLIAAFDLTDNVRIINGASLSELSTYYRHSDCFISMSEHEGFCVPIIEAQMLGLPVVALERGAVKDTTGDGQLTWNDPDYDVFATALQNVTINSELRDHLIEVGRRNAMRYKEENTTQAFVRALAAIGSIQVKEGP